MKCQLQFWYPSDLRLWRTGYVIYVKNDWWNSNAQCSRVCLQNKINIIIDSPTPKNPLQSHISMWDTLYMDQALLLFLLHFLHENLMYIELEKWINWIVLMCLTSFLCKLGHYKQGTLTNIRKDLRKKSESIDFPFWQKVLARKIPPLLLSNWQWHWKKQMATKKWKIFADGQMRLRLRTRS